MKRNLPILLSALFSLIALSGCATIISGEHQEIAVSTRPSDAAVYIDGFYEGDTPLIFDVERKGQHILTIEMPGYRTEEFVLDRELNPWVFGNIFTGVIFVAIDALTGAMWELDPDAIELELLREGSTASLEDGTLHMAVVMKPEPEWKKIGQLQRKTDPREIP